MSLKIMLLGLPFVFLPLVGQDCHLEINGFTKYTIIMVDGKPWPDAEAVHIGYRGSEKLIYNNKIYYILYIGPHGGGDDTYTVEVFSCEKKDIVGRFVLKERNKPEGAKIYTGSYKGNDVIDKIEDLLPWDGRTWFLNLDKMVLVQEWDGKEIPMTIDSPGGFYPDQQLDKPFYKNPEKQIPWKIKNKVKIQKKSNIRRKN